MNKYAKRLFYRSGMEPLNPLFHVFFWITLTVGICFVFFPVATGTTMSVLYQQTIISFPDTFISGWGMALLVITILNSLMLCFRVRFLGQVVGLSGAMAWLYAAWVYFLASYWFGFLTFALPNLAFWCYYYFRVSAYHHNPPSDI